ncbi:MAG: hypothetical protein BBJ57_07495 [Desulfobacterales bacterium PC51MH44]|nr:MAG: hypothetical protein BBJ57_07495 [Desulfobacterales bacterium PC51MH44]
MGKTLKISVFDKIKVTTAVLTSAAIVAFTPSDVLSNTIDYSQLKRADNQPGWYANLLDEDMSDITDWTDADNNNGVSSQTTFDSKSCMMFDTNTATSSNYARRSRDVGTFGDKVVVEMSVYFDSIGTLANIDQFQIQIQESACVLSANFCSDGLFIYDGAASNEVGTNIVVQDVWQKYTFDIDFTTPASATVDVYLDDILIATGVDCSYTGSFTDGYVQFSLNGITTSDNIAYVDYIKVYPRSAWDENNKHADIVLSDNDTVAGWEGADNTYGQVLGTMGHSSGQRYFEIEAIVDPVTANNFCCGVQNGNESLSVYVGDTSDGWGYMRNARWYNSALIYPDGSPTYANGDIINIAVDLDMGYLWFGKNGVWLSYSSSSPDPATGTDPSYSNLAGTIYPAISPYHPNWSGGLRSKRSEFAYEPPTGFLPWGIEEDLGGGDLSINVFDTVTVTEDVTVEIEALEINVFDTVTITENVDISIGYPINPADWANRIKITLDSDQIEEDLSDFPIPIYLSASSGPGNDDVSAIFDELASDANRFKIAVTLSDGITQCYTEIEAWEDSNEKAWLHVRVPNISSSADTELYIYYDSSQSDNTDYVGDAGSTVAENVWNSDFVRVWHLCQDPSGGAGAILDSTGNHDATSAGTMLTEDLVDGLFGKGLAFEGTDDHIVIDGCGLDGASEFTIVAVGNADVINFTAYRGLFSRGSGGQRVPWIFGNSGLDSVAYSLETEPGEIKGQLKSVTTAAFVTECSFGGGFEEYTNENMEMLYGWTTNTTGNATLTQESFSGRECYKIDTGGSPSSSYGQYLRDLGTFSDTVIIAEVDTYWSALGDDTNDYARIEVRHTGYTFQAIFRENSVLISKSVGSTNIGNLVEMDTWQTWRFEIDFTTPSAATCDIYLDGTPVATALDCNVAGGANGNIEVVQHGYTTANRIMYVSRFDVGDGTYRSATNFRLDGVANRPNKTATRDTTVGNTDGDNYIGKIASYEEWDGIISEIRVMLTKNSRAWSIATNAGFRDNLLSFEVIEALSISVFDTITVTEDVTADIQAAIEDLNINVFDTVTITENVSGNLPDPDTLYVDVFDTVTLSEAVTGHIEELHISVNDTITVSESVSADTFLLALFVDVYDDITVTEDVSASVGLPSLDSGNWVKKVKITIDKDQIDEDLYDFPVGIYLSASSGIDNDDMSPVFDELTLDANRKKIAVTAVDGVTQYYVEIERWVDADEEAWLHVRVPFVSSTEDTELYLYYDSSHADNTDAVGDVGDTPAQRVWDENFRLVAHLGEDPTGGAGCMKDSTINGNNGTPSSTMTAGDLVDGQFGKCLVFTPTDNNGDVVNHDSWPNLDDLVPLTVEVVIDAEGWGYGSTGVIVAKGLANLGNAQGWKLLMHSGYSGVMFIQRMSGNDGFWSFPFTMGDLQSVGVVYDNSDTDNDPDMYLDGALQTETEEITPTGIRSDDSSYSASIGGSIGDYRSTFDGRIDEVRISDGARSAAWIKATHLGLFDGMLTYGDEQLFGETDIQDTITVTDAVEVVVHLAINVFDTITVTETVVVTPEELTVFDTITVSEWVKIETPGVFYAQTMHLGVVQYTPTYHGYIELQDISVEFSMNETTYPLYGRMGQPLITGSRTKIICTGSGAYIDIESGGKPKILCEGAKPYIVCTGKDSKVRSTGY